MMVVGDCEQVGVTAGGKACDAEVGLTPPNPFERIADLFAILHNIFANPEVQKAGNAFLNTLESAMEREVDSGRHRNSLGR